MAVEIQQLGGNLGSRIEGINFKAGVSENEIEALAAALYQHQVISMPAADMTPEQHARIAARFGEAERNATDQFQHHPAIPHITILDSDKGDRADSWHADETFLQHPPLVNLLHGKVIPRLRWRHGIHQYRCGLRCAITQNPAFSGRRVVHRISALATRETYTGIQTAAPAS